MPTAIEQLNDLRIRREALNRDILEEGKKLFKEASAGIFENHPVLISFGWRQYTPYFADGDVCEFSAHTGYVKLRTSEDEDGEFSDSDLYDYSNGYRDKKLKDPLSARELAGRDILAFLKNFDDDNFKDMFGDHVKVGVTRDGVETEEYDHD